MRRRALRALPTSLIVAALLAAPIAATSAAAADGSAGPVGGPAMGTTGLVVDAPGAAPLPEVGASAWLLADLETGEVLAATDPHGRYRPASTLKVLTALTLLPRLEPGTIYAARWEDANSQGSRVGVVPDATYTVHQLFQALFLVSGNDAARALAHAAGGVPQTVAAMTSTARDLGALDTTVVNPSGLDADAQRTSAYDLAVITRAAMARDDFRDYVTTVKAQFPGKMPKPGKVRKSFEIYTQDRLLLDYRGAIGVKTGWTTKARGTFVGAATRDDRTLVATVLHTEGDGWRDARELLQWGFATGAAAHPVGTLDTSTSAAVGEAGQRVGPPSAARATSVAGGAPGPSLPWWLTVPLLAGSAIVLLRLRVLVRRRGHRYRPPVRPGSVLPRQARLSRDLRRAPATPQPTAAPMSAPGNVRLLGSDAAGAAGVAGSATAPASPPESVRTGA